MRRAFLLAIPLVLAACGGAQGISGTNLDRLVLQQQDVGAAFEQFNSGAQVRLDNEGTPRSDPTRFGREGGWIARFRRGGSAQTRGPLVVESRVDVFKSSDGAKSDFGEYKTLLCGLPGTRMPAWLKGAYTEVECNSAPLGPPPTDVVVSGLYSDDQLKALVDYVQTSFMKQPMPTWTAAK